MKEQLVLISGLLSDESLWEHQVQHLCDSASISIFHPNEDTPEKMIENILKHTPSHFALAGHSMGGWLCLELLKAAPSRISKVCLLNTTDRADSEEKRKKRQAMIAKCEEGKFDEVVDGLVNFLTEIPKIKQDVKMMFMRVGQNAFINQEKSMLIREPSASILPTIHCPVLVIHASKDKNFSAEEHEELVEKIPNAKLAIIEDCGHMSPLETPQAVTALLRFWLTYF